MTSKPYKPTASPLNGCMCQDGTCESCNRVVEAWEAMREALENTPEQPHLPDFLGINESVTRLMRYCESLNEWFEGRRKSALALADEAAKGKL